jgi:hypothetical protein
MMPALVAAVAGIRHVLGRARRPLAAPATPWTTFARGRVLDGRRDALGAFRCNLVAAQGGLPVAAVFVWLAYRVGGGVHADPIATHAWARQATGLGWPEGVLEPGDAVGGHQQEPGGRP